MLRHIQSFAAIALIAVFGVFLPTHRIGAVRLPGATSPTAAAMSLRAGAPCCTTTPASQPGDENGTPLPPQRTCAICFMLTLSVPAAPPALAPLTSELLERLPAPAAYRAPQPGRVLSYSSRGPPAEASA